MEEKAASSPSPTTPKSASLMHEFDPKPASTMASQKLIALFLVVVLLGVGTGFALARKGGETGIASLDKATRSTAIPRGKTYGTDDPAFKDTTEGIVKEGGIAGEGQYHLVRPGGESQNVYLTSSSVDLSKFIDRKIKVWGQTQQGQKAGWLMDVGRVEVLD